MLFRRDCVCYVHTRNIPNCVYVGCPNQTQILLMCTLSDTTHKGLCVFYPNTKQNVVCVSSKYETDHIVFKIQIQYLI